MRKLATFLLLLLAGCAEYHAFGLKPGSATQAEVERAMGQPAQRWANPDGSAQWAYVSGPAGYRSYMLRLDKGGTLQSIEVVTREESFARITPGMNQDQVLRTLGPPQPSWTTRFAARNELVWEWRYCDAWGFAARFDVMMDADSGLVRSTDHRREMCGHVDCWCGH
ncbi:MAG TPA: hypothetical protein VI279_02495 [Rhodocyclaceae bacterium]